ncbi:hypothetical protein [Aeromicrobium sp. Root472D3]|uniref:hypothetical protein n=1 Tax=Aeromicrobium sp. Root472D3 TaxID=1736540 RepID=UPI0012F7A8EE|nr:hypothetical protein [Aeromicrobium sp. Root472D3]
MTIVRTDPDHHLDTTRDALRRTADAWEHALTAAIDHDVREARLVMRGAPSRRSVLRCAHQQLQWAESPHRRDAPRRATPLDVVSDLVRMNRQLSQLSQSIIAAPEVAGLDARERAAVDVARRIGAQRLQVFAGSMPRPRIDREYVAAGHDLLDALADLAESRPSRGSTSDACLGLVVTLVETSRHATRVA